MSRLDPASLPHGGSRIGRVFQRPLFGLLASDAIDTISLPARSILPTQVTPAQPGSAAFRNALAVLVKGDQAAPTGWRANLPYGARAADHPVGRDLLWQRPHPTTNAVALFAKDAPGIRSPALFENAHRAVPRNLQSE